MPKIPKEVLDSTFYLFPSYEDAKRGENYGGTGFLIGVPIKSDPSRMCVYAVTNWHVACQGSPVIRVNNKDGATNIVDLDCSEWIFSPHSDDIAIIPFRNEPSHKVSFIPTTIFASREEILSRQIGPGEDVFMVGRFIDADGGHVNRPAARFGNISLMPIPMVQDNGATRASYVIDLHSRDGFSGSPVFVYRTTGQDLTTQTIVLGSQFLLLLGIHWGQFPEEWEIIQRKQKQKHEAAPAEAKVEADAHFVRGLSGMTCVAPAHAILELLEDPKLKAFQDSAEEMCAREKLLRQPAAEITFDPEADVSADAFLQRPGPLGKP